jgi:hypothetical protein
MINHILCLSLLIVVFIVPNYWIGKSMLQHQNPDYDPVGFKGFMWCWDLGFIVMIIVVFGGGLVLGTIYCIFKAIKKCFTT